MNRTDLLYSDHELRIKKIELFVSEQLNILISTIDDGIRKLDRVLLSPIEGVSYIVSHQYTDEEYIKIPGFLIRDDVQISQIRGKGVTRSRNNALRLAEGDIGLFSDDDVTYRKEYFDRIKEKFRNHPELDVGLFKIKTGKNEPEYKKYPEKEMTYRRAPSIGTVEMAVRLKKVKEKGIFFDERFGAGQPLLIGSDEMLFAQDCIDSGLTVRFYPEYIVEHRYESTVNAIPRYDKRRIWVTGGVDCKRHGIKALFKAFFGTFKILPDLLTNRVNPFYYFYHRLSAVVYILRTNRTHNKKHNR